MKCPQTILGKASLNLISDELSQHISSIRDGTYLRHSQTPRVGPAVLVWSTACPVCTDLALVRSPKAESLLWRGRQGWDWVEYRMGVLDPK